MSTFINDPANNVLFHCYFDVQAGDGHHQLSPGLNGNEKPEFPLSTAKFLELFAPPVAVAAPRKTTVAPRKTAPLAPKKTAPVARRKCFVASGEKSTPRHFSHHFHTRCRLRLAT